MKRLFLLPILLVAACSHESGKTAKKTGASAHSVHPKKTTDSIAPESQLTRIDHAKRAHFPESEVSKAVAYSFLDDHDYEDDSLTKGQLLPIMPDYSQYLWKYDRHPKVRLNRRQARHLLSIINDPKNYGVGAAFCYSPRNCFCFYDAKNEIIGFYELCFECSRIESIPQFTSSRKGGLSDKGVRELKRFCQAAGVTVLKQ